MPKPDSRDQITVPSIELRANASQQSYKKKSTNFAKNPTLLNETSLEGTTLDKRFRILERVGQGGMSEVYKAEHIMLQKMVAIKVLHKQQELESIERFQQEAKAISALDHQNIVKVYAFGASEQDRLYLAMDFLEGKSLSDILEAEQRLSWRRVVEYGIQIAQGLEQAHARGIVHRDLKPSNIIIDVDEYNNEIVKVVDFGIAKLTEESGKEVKDLTQDGNTCGSPPYMSPEQCMGETSDARSDVYSFGIMLYELLTGVRPISGRSALEMMTNHVEQTPEFFETSCPKAEIPASLETIVRKCLEKDRNDRYQSMSDIQRDLKQVGSNSDEETDLADSNQKALTTRKDQEKQQRRRTAILAVSIGGIILASSVALICSFYLPQKELTDLKSRVEKLNLESPKFPKEMAILVPQLIDKLEKNQDSASKLSVVRKLKKRILAEPDSIHKFLGMSELAQIYRKLGLDTDAADLENLTVGGLLQYGTSMRDARKNISEAQRALTKCATLCTQYHKSRTVTLSVMNQLFTAYLHDDNFAKAEQTARESIEIAKGGLPLEQCLAYFNLGNVLIEVGKISAAELAYREAWKHCLTVYAVDSELSKSISKQLIDCLQKLGKAEELKTVVKQLDPAQQQE